jgi:hypothetical protein
VKDSRQKDFQIQNYLPVIASTFINGAGGTKKIVYFDPCWFQITTPDKEVNLYFRNPFDETLVQLNVKVFVTLILQRIQ